MEDQEVSPGGKFPTVTTTRKKEDRGARIAGP